MKSLDELNQSMAAETANLAEAAWDRLGGEQNILLASKKEIFTLQQHTVIQNKFLQLYEIVKLLDSYLQIPTTDGRADRQDLRKQLREMIAQI